MSSARMAIVAAAIAVTPALPFARAWSQPQFSAGTELVVLHVTVTDRDGYVAHLPKEAFTVLEDGVAQPIRFFGGHDAPATIGLLVDGSGSMREGRDRVIAAMTAFVEDSHPQNEVFALAFSDTVTSVLPDGMSFTSDAAILHAALRDAVRARGRTALYDALVAGFERATGGTHTRRALVVVADGGDNASEARFETVLRRAHASNAAIYAVGLVDPLDREASPRRLRELAAATGGLAEFPRRLEDVPGALARIGDDLRHGYTLGYVPSAGQDGRLHQLQVDVTLPDRRRATVRTRAAYLAGPHPVEEGP